MAKGTSVPTSGLLGGSISAILEGKLYLGNRAAAVDLPLLQSLGVTHVVNAAEELPNFYPDDFVYYNCHLKDDLTETIDFDGALGFIQGALDSGGVVFVHCLAGASRSASLVIAFLMKTQGLCLRDAMARAVACRPCVSPNPNYLRQLLGLDILLHGKGSVDLNELLALRLKSLLVFLDTEVLTDIVRQCNGDFDQALERSIALAMRSPK
eukprot:RCo000112